MNRTTKFAALYVVAAVTLLGISLAAIDVSNKDPLAIVGIVIALLLPGRICGYYWRDFFRGRNLMTRGKFSEAESRFEEFLATVDERPWIKNLMIFSWGMYTRDVEVMTLNNLGAIKIEQGKFQAGKEFLRRAIALDAQAPLPYFNLALIAAAEGNNDLAKELLQDSQERGFTGSSRDQLIRQAGELLARIEGPVPAERVSGGNDGPRGGDLEPT